MYLQNTSDTVVVMINTVVGRFGLRPKEVINLEQKLLPPVSEHIVKITEEEYNNFRKGTEKVEEQTQEIESTDENADTAMDNEAVVDETTQEVLEDITKSLQDSNTANFIQQLLNINPPTSPKEKPVEPAFEEQGEDTTTDALKVNSTDSSGELQTMEKQLEELKKAWAGTKVVKKKDKISKQIKELQKQIDKLKKDTSADE